MERPVEPPFPVRDRSTFLTEKLRFFEIFLICKSDMGQHLPGKRLIDGRNSCDIRNRITGLIGLF